MEPGRAARATAAAAATASSLGLAVGDHLPLSSSNALVLRLLPCDVVARVTTGEAGPAQRELDLAAHLAAAAAPVAGPDPRVPPVAHERDGFVVTFWTHHAGRGEPAPAAYAEALGRLHAALRSVPVEVPHVGERLAGARRSLEDHDRTPDLPAGDREFLIDVLRDVPSGGADQLLHGEPHPGNVLATADGPRFVDFETCCRGPVEFDLAHAPDAVAGHYPGLDAGLLARCRRLALALVTTWRWDRDDRFPDGRRAGRRWLAQLRAATP